MRSIYQDMRSAFRGFANSRTFTLAGLLTIALSTGAGTAIFSIVDAVLLRPFPYHEPDSVVLLWGSEDFSVRSGIPGPDLADLQKAAILEGVAPFLCDFDVYMGGEEVEPVRACYVGAEIFPVLGVPVLLGRPLLGTDNEPEANRVAILSHRIWTNRFASDPEALGRTLHLEGESYQIAGIMPPNFFFPDQNVDIWLPLKRNFPGIEKRGHPLLLAVGRLKPGQNLQNAVSQVEVFSQKLQRSFPDTNKNRTIGVFPMHEVVVAEYGKALWTLVGAVSLLFLIGCANVAHLMLTRGLARQKEIAVRSALGATYGRIARQLLIESLLFALLGGAGGLFVALFILKLVSNLGLTDIPRLAQTSLNVNVLLFAFLVSLSAGVLSGLAPSLAARKIDVADSLKGGRPGSFASKGKLVRYLLVVGQVSAAMILLAAAGLLANSFLRAMGADWGFNYERVLVVETEFPSAQYSEAQKWIHFIEPCLENLRRLPGVRSAAVGDAIPLKLAQHRGAPLAAEGRILSGASIPQRFSVSPEFFQTLGVPVLRGREFVSTDNSTVKRAVLINDALARQLWPQRDPVGRHVQLMRIRPEVRAEALRRMAQGGSIQEFKTSFLEKTLVDPRSWEKAEEQPREILGVVGSARMFSLERESRPAVFFDYREPSAVLPSSHLTILVRTAGDPTRMFEPVKASIQQVAQNHVIREIITMQDLIDRSMGGRGSNRLMLLASTSLSLLATILAAVGIYGVLSYQVELRANEMGVRMALGALPRNILFQILREGTALTLFGLTIGTFGALFFGRLLSAFLFGVTPTDPATLAGASFFLFLVALLACLAPAAKAARVDPIAALRHE